MKRSEALAILSRDHHHALVVALQLKRADDRTAEPARAGFLDFWTREGRRHFQLEEELLLPAFAKHGDARHQLVLQVLGDHVAIRAQAAQLAAAAEPTTQALHELGIALADHVRLRRHLRLGDVRLLQRRGGRDLISRVRPRTDRLVGDARHRSWRPRDGDSGDDEARAWRVWLRGPRISGRPRGRSCLEGSNRKTEDLPAADPAGDPRAGGLTGPAARGKAARPAV